MARFCAALAVMIKHFLSAHLFIIKRRDQEEAIQKQVIGALLDHQHDPTRLVPAVGPIAQRVQPHSGLSGRPSRGPFHVGRGQPVQSGVGPEPRDIVDIACLQPGEQRRRWKARIDAHHRDIAKAGLRAVDHVKNNVERPLSGADISGTQARIKHVTGFGHGGDQWVVDATMIMTVPFGLGLMAMDLDGHAVDIECEPLRPFATSFRPSPTGAELQHRLAQHRSVGRRSHDGGKPRECGLGWQAPLPQQRRLSSRGTDRQSKCRVIAKGSAYCFVTQSRQGELIRGMA